MYIEHMDNRPKEATIFLTDEGKSIQLPNTEVRRIIPEPGRHPSNGFFPEGYAYQAFEIEGEKKSDGAKVEIIGRTPLQLIEYRDTLPQEVRVCEIPTSGQLTLFIFNTNKEKGELETYDCNPLEDDMSIMFELIPGELMCWYAWPGQESAPAEVLEYTEPKFENLTFTDIHLDLKENYTQQDLAEAIRKKGQEIQKNRFSRLE